MKQRKVEVEYQCGFVVYHKIDRKHYLWQYQIITRIYIYVWFQKCEIKLVYTV